MTTHNWTINNNLQFVYTDSRSNHTTLYCGIAQLEWHATASVLWQRRCLCEYGRSSVQEHCATGNIHGFAEIILDKNDFGISVGRDANIRRIHWNRSNHGLGQQSNRSMYFRLISTQIQNGLKLTFIHFGYRFVPWNLVISMEFSCIRKLSVSNSSANGTTRCFSAVPKVLHRVKFTLWHSTNPEWQIGRANKTNETKWQKNRRIPGLA